MKSLANLTKAPVTFEYEGAQYRLSPLELGDLGEVERWLEALPFERAARKIEALGSAADLEAKGKLLAAAEEESLEAGLHSPRSMKVLASFEGTAFLLHLSLGKNHPELTRQQVANMITLETLEAWQKRLDMVSGLSGGDGPDPTGAARCEGR